MDPEQPSLGDFSDEGDDSSDDGQHQTVVRHLLFRLRLVCLPESWLLSIENISITWIVQSLKSRRKMGNMILLMLIFFVFFSAFCKLLLLSHEEMDGMRRENGIMILQNIKDDGAMAQRAVREDEASEDVVSKQLLEKFPVIEILD